MTLQVLLRPPRDQRHGAASAPALARAEWPSAIARADHDRKVQETFDGDPMGAPSDELA